MIHQLGSTRATLGFIALLLSLVNGCSGGEDDVAYPPCGGL
jgi:hypothetical protein